MERRHETPHPIAMRLWEAARLEFSFRGYHGARVQAIAQSAGFNVALLYRTWRSKKELYLAILRSITHDLRGRLTVALGTEKSVRTMVVAYLDALMIDPVAARIIVREVVDGGPFLSQLDDLDPGLTREAATAIAAAGDASRLRSGVDPTLAVITVAAVAALGAATLESTAAYLGRAVAPDELRRHLHDLLLQGLALPDRAAE